MHHSHSRIQKRRALLRPFLIGLAVFIVIGGEGLLYQQLRNDKNEAFVFDPTSYANPLEHQQLVEGTLTVQTLCTNPVVVSGEDINALNPRTLTRHGRPVTDGAFKTIMLKEEPTFLSVYDDAGVLCLAGLYTPTGSKVAITPQISASTFDPLQFDMAGMMSTTPTQNLPSYSEFFSYLSNALATNLLSQVMASTQYQDYVTKLKAETVATLLTES